MKWKLIILGVLVLLMFGLMLTEGILIPKQLQPDVLPLRLVSVSVTENGKEAVYELRNNSAAAVDVWAAATLHVGTSTQFEVQEVQIEPQAIERQKKGIIKVPLPVGKEWQVQLRVSPHLAQSATVVFSEWSK